MKTKCLICPRELRGKQEKYCSDLCQRKSWKINRREIYLESKKRYREKHREQINAYQRDHYKNSDGDKWQKVRKILLKDCPCICCGTIEDLHIHHVRPKDIGGKDVIGNLVVLCCRCHQEWHKVFPENYWETER